MQFTHAIIRADASAEGVKSARSHLLQSEHIVSVEGVKRARSHMLQ